MSKVVVITGASGGIGEATARLLAARGDRLVLAARREGELRRVAASLGGEVLTVVTDVTRREQVVALYDAALGRFGRIDVWINNAGRGISRNVLDLTDREFDEIMAVNLKSALYGMQAVVPHFQERGEGHLINVSSFLAGAYAAIRSAYNAAKAGVNALTANLRMDLRRTHPKVHVSVLMPSIVATGFFDHAMGEPTPMPTGTPVPPQTPEEVAAILVDLIDHPRAEAYSHPRLKDMALHYYSDVEAAEAERGGR